ncbi:MAG: hypothetical protein EOP05_04500, partial [Proteobacteria bacterium]
MAKARTTRKTTSKSASTKLQSVTAMGLPLTTWISTARRAKGGEVRSGSRAFILALSSRDLKSARAALTQHLNKWQLTSVAENDSELLQFQGAQGLMAVIRPSTAKVAAVGSTDEQLQKSPYARMRDLAGSVLSSALSQRVEKLVIETSGATSEERQGLLVGLEMASYSFAENRENPRRPRKTLPQILLRGGEGEFSDAEISEASRMALSINIARHLVNTPAGDLNPRTYAECVEAMFSSSSTVTVEVLEGQRLIDENM